MFTVTLVDVERSVTESAVGCWLAHFESTERDLVLVMTWTIQSTELELRWIEFELTRSNFFLTFLFWNLITVPVRFGSVPVRFRFGSNQNRNRTVSSGSRKYGTGTEPNRKIRFGSGSEPNRNNPIHQCNPQSTSQLLPMYSICHMLHSILATALY